MKAKEFLEYESTVIEFFIRDDIERVEHRQFCELYYSESPCEACGDPTFGSRHTVDAIHRTGESTLYGLCDNCVYYIAHGRLDDKTAMSMITERHRRDLGKVRKTHPHLFAETPDEETQASRPGRGNR